MDTITTQELEISQNAETQTTLFNIWKEWESASTIEYKLTSKLGIFFAHFNKSYEETDCVWGIENLALYFLERQHGITANDLCKLVDSCHEKGAYACIYKINLKHTTQTTKHTKQKL